VVEDVLESLAAQGFKALVVWRGCGQHDLRAAIGRFNASHRGCAAFQPVIDYGTVSETAFGRAVPGGHADSIATSIRLHLGGKDVRLEKVRMPGLRRFEWGDDVDFAAISDTGVVGDPTQASAEVGARIWELCVSEGAELTRLLLEGRADRVRQTWHFRSPK
jgi:creatinine amidohydrolase